MSDTNTPTTEENIGGVPTGAASLLKRDNPETDKSFMKDTYKGESSDDEQPEVVAEVSETDPEPQVEDNSVEDEDAAWLSEDEADEPETAEVEEETEASSTTFKFTDHDGEEVEWNEQDMQRARGQQKKLEAEKAELKQAMEAIEYLKVQEAVRPKLYEYERDKAELDDAFKAWTSGEDYNGIPNAALGDTIRKAEYALNQRKAEIDTEMQTTQLPGLDVLKARIPNLDEKTFNEKAEDWGKVAKEFGFTEIEVESKDFRDMAMAEEIMELRRFKADIEAKREKFKKKPKGKVAGKPVESQPSARTGGGEASDGPDIDSVTDKARSGSREAAVEWGKAAGSIMRRK